MDKTRLWSQVSLPGYYPHLKRKPYGDRYYFCLLGCLNSSKYTELICCYPFPQAFIIKVVANVQIHWHINAKEEH